MVDTIGVRTLAEYAVVMKSGTVQTQKQSQASNEDTPMGPFCISETVITAQDDKDLPELEAGLSSFHLFEDQWQQYTLHCDADATQLLPLLDSFLGRGALPRTQAFKVAFTEALSNALYHAQGRPKGSHSSDAFKRPIAVELGFDDQYLYASIRDQAGQLDAETIVKHIEAAQSHEHICPETLEMTHGGRGLFLIATLIQDVQIVTAPGQYSEVRLKQPRHITALRQTGQSLEIISVTGLDSTAEAV